MLSIIIVLVMFQFGNAMEQPPYSSSSMDILLTKHENVDSIILIDTTLCHGEFLVINGVIYDMDNPAGTEVVSNGSSEDIIYIELDFYPSITITITEAVCEDVPDPPVEGTLILIDQNGCDSTIVYEVIILPSNDPACTESSISEENIKEKWLCYPNPIKDIFIIEAAGYHGAVSFSIMTNEGRSILSGRLNADRNEIDLQNIPTGYYILGIKGGSGTTYKKLLKM